MGAYVVMVNIACLVSRIVMVRDGYVVALMMAMMHMIRTKS